MWGIIFPPLPKPKKGTVYFLSSKKINSAKTLAGIWYETVLATAVTGSKAASFQVAPPSAAGAMQFNSAQSALECTHCILQWTSLTPGSIDFTKTWDKEILLFRLCKRILGSGAWNKSCTTAIRKAERAASMQSHQGPACPYHAARLQWPQTSGLGSYSNPVGEVRAMSHNPQLELSHSSQCFCSLLRYGI